MGATVGNIGEDPRSWHPAREHVPFTDEDLQRPLLARFADIVGRFPDRPALKDGDRQLSYRELRASYRAVLDGHRPRQSYAGRVVTIASRETLNWDGLAGWRALIPDLEVHAVEGTHATYLSAGVQATAQELRACLAEARFGED